MPGTMSRADLITDLKGSLHESAQVFTAAIDTDFSRLLDAAALAFVRPRPRTVVGSVTLVAETDSYAAPADLIDYKSDLWSVGKMPPPWESTYPGRLPMVRLAEVAGARRLVFSPAPSAQHLAVLGAEFKFYYFAAHVIGTAAEQTTIAAGDRGLLLLRAQAEAMRELSMRNITKPMQLRDGVTSAPRNGQPSHLYGLLLEEFERRVAA